MVKFETRFDGNKGTHCIDIYRVSGSQFYTGGSLKRHMFRI